MFRHSSIFWRYWILACLLGSFCIACGDEEGQILETVTQPLTVNCAGSTADFGTLEFAMVRADYGNRPETLEFAVMPQGGPVSLDCSTTIDDITLGPVNRLPVGQAVFAFQFMGRGGCSTEFHQVLAQSVVFCDLTATTLPVSCPVTTQPLACAEF